MCLIVRAITLANQNSSKPPTAAIARCEGVLLRQKTTQRTKRARLIYTTEVVVEELFLTRSIVKVGLEAEVW